MSTRVGQATSVAVRTGRAGVVLDDINQWVRSETDFIWHMVWSCRPDGEPDFYSDQCFAYLGLPVQPASAMSWFSAIHPMDRSRTVERWQRSVATGELYEVEFRIRHRSGQYRWLLARATPQHDANGAVSRWFGSSVDVEEIIGLRAAVARVRRGLAEESRERADARDRAWRHSPDLLCVLDAAGVVRAINPACTALLGWLPEEIVGRHYAAFIHPDDRPASEAALSAARGKPGPRHEGRVLHRDGSYRWFAWAGALHDASIFAYGRHVTAEKEAAAARACAEAEQWHAQKMDAIGQLAGGIAHDFNNLLQALSSGLDVIGARHIQSEDGRRLIRQACGVIERGAALTTQLLAFARKQQLAPRVIDLNATLLSAAGSLASKIGGDTPIIWQQEGPVWPAVADPQQLESAVLNLLLNARDAMPRGGTITVSTHNVAAGPALPFELAPGDYVALTVADTGVGMTDDVRAHACEPFFTTKGLGSGVGLGLSQVHGFAGQSGGTVRIASAPGCGTTVELLLPRGQAADLDDAMSGEPEAVAGSETILVVDDDADVRETTVAGLQDCGYRVLEAAGGAQCLRVLERETVDLLVVDFAMPSMNGAELVRLARRTHPGIKVLFMTGYADLDALRFYADPRDILRKPFRLAALIEQVEGALRR